MDSAKVAPSSGGGEKGGPPPAKGPSSSRKSGDGDAGNASKAVPRSSSVLRRKKGKMKRNRKSGRTVRSHRSKKRSSRHRGSIVRMQEALELRKTTLATHAEALSTDEAAAVAGGVAAARASQRARTSAILQRRASVSAEAEAEAAGAAEEEGAAAAAAEEETPPPPAPEAEAAAAAAAEEETPPPAAAEAEAAGTEGEASPSSPAAKVKAVRKASALANDLRLKRPEKKYSEKRDELEAYADRLQDRLNALKQYMEPANVAVVHDQIQGALEWIQASEMRRSGVRAEPKEFDAKVKELRLDAGKLLDKAEARAQEQAAAEAEAARARQAAGKAAWDAAQAANAPTAPLTKEEEMTIFLLEGGEAMTHQAEVICKALQDGPFIFNLGHGVIKETNPDSVTLLIETIRKIQRQAN